MFLEEIQSIFPGQRIKIKYDCDGNYKRCGKEFSLKLSDAMHNFKTNNEKHVCHSCQLKARNKSKNEKTLEKTRKTNLEKYGTVCPLNTKANIAARVEKMFGSEESVKKIVANRRKTSQERYGADHIMKTEEGQRRQKEAMQEKFGVDHPLQSEECREKMKQTCMERYGVENPLSLPEVRAKGAATCLELYGVEHYNQLPEMKEYLRENCTSWLAESYANPWAKGIIRPEEWNDKQRETVMDLIDAGNWNSGPKYSLRGYFNSEKCKRKRPMFRSSYELKVHWHLDNDPEVEWYDYEPFRVPYRDAVGKRRYYIIDFIVKYKSRPKPLALEVKNDYNLERFIECGKKESFLEECYNMLDFLIWSNNDILLLNLDLETLLESDKVEKL